MEKERKIEITTGGIYSNSNLPPPRTAAAMSIIERDSVEDSRIDREVFSALSRARPHMTPIQRRGGPGGRSVGGLVVDRGAR